jgi:hypothetical protein
MLLYIDESGYTGEDRQFNTKVLRIVFVSMLIRSICIVPWRPKTPGTKSYMRIDEFIKHCKEMNT